MPTPTSTLESEFYDCQDQPLTLEALDTLRAVEREAATTLGAHSLMARAGEAIAAFIVSSLAEASSNPSNHGAAASGDMAAAADRATRAARATKPLVWLFAGPGNNGGDALCAAASLRRRRIDAQVCLPVEPRSSEGQWALQQARDAAVPLHTAFPADVDWHTPPWMIDGLFGIGLNRPVSGVFADIARALSARTAAGGRVLALDVPSGLDSETGTVVVGALPGQPLGNASGDAFEDKPDRKSKSASEDDSAGKSDSTPTGIAVEASHTLTFLAAKPGLFTGKGRDLAGRIFVAPVGLGPQSFEHARRHADTPSPAVELNAPARFVRAFPRRRPSSHKGTFGSVAIVGGDTGTCGAVILAARAALYCGAGRIHTALIGEGGPAYDPPHPEIMMHHIDAIALDTMDALAIGPGLGKTDRAAAILRTMLDLDLDKLIDADALNLTSTHPDIADRLRAHGHRIVITPHPAEAARLLGVKTPDIERDRLAAARRLVDTYHCTVVLKGSGTIIAAPDGRIAINATGNAGLSTGGTGDVLSGVIGAFLAQHVPPFEAALAATYVHGRAAEHLEQAGTGPAGLTAGELAPTMRALLNTLFRDFHLI